MIDKFVLKLNKTYNNSITSNIKYINDYNDQANKNFDLNTILKLGPLQPNANFIFPVINGRKMSIFYFQSYPYLSYSKMLDKLFCFYCLYLRKKDKESLNDIFYTGYNAWSHLTRD